MGIPEILLLGVRRQPQLRFIDVERAELYGRAIAPSRSSTLGVPSTETARFHESLAWERDHNLFGLIGL